MLIMRVYDTEFALCEEIALDAFFNQRKWYFAYSYPQIYGGYTFDIQKYMFWYTKITFLLYLFSVDFIYSDVSCSMWFFGQKNTNVLLFLYSCAYSLKPPQLI